MNCCNNKNIIFTDYYVCISLWNYTWIMNIYMKILIYEK